MTITAINNLMHYTADPLGSVLAESSLIRQQLGTLTQQAADGKIADTFAGLGSGASTSLALRAALGHAQTVQSGISAATGTMGVAQTALKEISQIASTFYSDATSLNAVSPSQIDSIAGDARDALRQVAGLLDSTDGGVYVFAGQDSGNPPIPNPDQIGTSPFAAAISSAVGALATNGASATAAATLAIAASNASATSPFSAALSQPAAALGALRPTISTGDLQSVPTGIIASANADVTSTGTSTTGSYMRDIMRALATLGSLSSAHATDPGFAQLVNDTRSSLGGAITALNQDAGIMGDRQTALAQRSADLGQTATTLQVQISGSEDVDMAKTLSQLSATQTQLQASYQIIAALQNLSLTKYITG